MTSHFLFKIMFLMHSTLAFLTRKSAALLENEELQKLLDLLEDNLSPPVEDRMINFEDYLKVRCYDKLFKGGYKSSYQDLTASEFSYRQQL